MSEPEIRGQHRLEVGSRVVVRSRFDGSWARGFEIAEVTDNGYRIRRRSDEVVLPVQFALEDVRAEQRSPGSR